MSLNRYLAGTEEHLRIFYSIVERSDRIARELGASILHSTDHLLS